MKKAKALFFLFDRPIFFSFYKQAPPGRPVPGRLSVLETEIRRQLKELLESLTNKRKKKCFIYIQYSIPYYYIIISQGSLLAY